MKNGIITALMLIILILAVALINKLPSIMGGNYGSFIIVIIIIFGIVVLARAGNN